MAAQALRDKYRAKNGALILRQDSGVGWRIPEDRT
jgi:hypothetical protein